MSYTENVNVIRERCYRSTGGINGRCNSESWWVKNNLDKIYSDILSFTEFLPSTAGIGRKLFHYVNKIDSIPQCKRNECNKPVNWQISINGYSTFCSSRCNALHNKREGADNCFGKSTTKEKIKETNSSRYGVDNYSKTAGFKRLMSEYHHNIPDKVKQEVQQKREQTNLERYGTITPLISPEIKSKVTETLQRNFGVSSPLQNTAILNKAKNTNRVRYGRDSYQQQHLSESFIEHIRDKDWIEDQLQHKSLRDIAIQHGISYSHLCKLVTASGISLANYSSFEKEVADYVKEVSICDVRINDRSVLHGKEIDILLPSLKIGIECNGVYWHGEKHGKHSLFHLNKSKMAKEQGIDLIHIFENEWISKTNIVKSRLNLLLKKNTQRIYARKCTVVPVNIDNERVFLENNHLQGYVSSKVCYGLICDDILVALMSFSKPRYNRNYDWELLRFACKLDTIILGGAEKLFKYFVGITCPKNVISYCDRRWFTGSVYGKMGFTFSHHSTPNYYYVEADGRLSSRIKYQKHKLHRVLNVFDPALSEFDNMKNNGYDRIWDCGNSVWIWSPADKYE